MFNPDLEISLGVLGLCGQRREFYQAAIELHQTKIF
jgi:hypothetical protein